MTTAKDIQGWIDQGLNRKATHLFVVCDTFDWENYPVYVQSGMNAKAEYGLHHEINMQKVMEVYNLSLPIEPQLREKRAFNF